MGCDIHMIVQLRRGNGEWVPAPVPGYGDRCYDLFARLAGVRSDGSIEPISEPRGLPKDLGVGPSDSSDAYTKATYLEDRCWCSYDLDPLTSIDPDNPLPAGQVWLGCHSFSWLLLSELGEVDGPDGWKRFLSALRSMDFDGTGQRVRIVFGFDS